MGIDWFVVIASLVIPKCLETCYIPDELLDLCFQDLVSLVTCGLLGEALFSQCVLARRGALDVFSALENPQGVISGRDTDAHNEAILALLESIFPSDLHGLTEYAKSEFLIVNALISRSPLT